MDIETLLKARAILDENEVRTEGRLAYIEGHFYGEGSVQTEESKAVAKAMIERLGTGL